MRKRKLAACGVWRVLTWCIDIPCGSVVAAFMAKAQEKVTVKIVRYIGMSANNQAVIRVMKFYWRERLKRQTHLPD